MKFHVCWSHGKDAGPHGAKSDALMKVAQDMGHETAFLDYRGITNPDERVTVLFDHCSRVSLPLVLAGSSMGGYVSAIVAEKILVSGLFLLAPALYLPGFDVQACRLQARCITVVHGWRDDVIPPENSFRFAKETKADLHYFDADHRLKEIVPDLVQLFRWFLETKPLGRPGS